MTTKRLLVEFVLGREKKKKSANEVLSLLIYISFRKLQTAHLKGNVVELCAPLSAILVYKLKQHLLICQ